MHFLRHIKLDNCLSLREEKIVVDGQNDFNCLKKRLKVLKEILLR